MRWTCLMIAALTAGCVSSGINVSQADIASFTPGQTTEAQVIARLGEPSNAATAPDGTKTDMYIHVAASANAASYVPVVGLLAGGSTSRTNSATFVFNRAGVLVSTASGQGHSNMNTGLLNQ